MEDQSGQPSPDQDQQLHEWHSLRERIAIIATGILAGAGGAIAAIDLLADGKFSQVGEIASGGALVAIAFGCTVLFMSRRGWLP